MGFEFLATLACAVGLSAPSGPRTAYFADGYHGGVHGHYPSGYTASLVEQLRAHPDWRINLEIEPETWDFARLSEPEAYAAFKAILESRADAGRVEIVNPTYAQSYLFQSSDQPATVSVIEAGPLRATVEIAGSPFLQRVSITQGSPRIDCFARIDWQGDPRIGEYEEKEGWRNRRRPAYDDRFKLLVLFPTRLTNQRVVKNAPFDVCESGLADTFYGSWDAIRNNVILDWVDVTDGTGRWRLALFSDHTTSHTHGRRSPLGLTVQYAGKGLWGRDYRVEGPTEARYALVSHAGRWEEAGLPAIAATWLEPALGALGGGGERSVRSLIDPGDAGWTIPAMFEKDGALHVRLFNAGGDESVRDLGVGFEAGTIELVELNGRVVEELRPVKDGSGRRTIRLGIPRFGIRTLRLSGLSPAGAAPRD